jgi:hypothetical protein
VVLIDNYMNFEDLGTKDDKVDGELKSLADQYGSQGLHFILAGNADIIRLNSLAKQVRDSSYGLGLQDEKSVEALDGRIPHGKRGAGALPPGRGYVIKSGKSELIQVALVSADFDQAAEVDEQIEIIRQQSEGKAAYWLHPKDSGGPETAGPGPRFNVKPWVRKEPKPEDPPNPS